MSKKFIVRFRRPDGTEAYLGKPNAGAAETVDDADQMSETDAGHVIAMRQGTCGYSYWVEPVKG